MEKQAHLNDVQRSALAHMVDAAGMPEVLRCLASLVRFRSLGPSEEAASLLFRVANDIALHEEAALKKGK